MNATTAFTLATSTRLDSAQDLEAALRQIGATRYHSLHPFHGLLHGVIDDLLSDNSEDLTRLQQVLKLHGFPKPYLDWEPPARRRQLLPF